MSELSIHELETQHGELLPEREALGGVNLFSFDNNVLVSAHQSVTAVQALTAFSANKAVGVQQIIIGG